jgi:hypothetical protein
MQTYKRECKYDRSRGTFSRDRVSIFQFIARLFLRVQKMKRVLSVVRAHPFPLLSHRVRRMMDKTIGRSRVAMSWPVSMQIQSLA